MYNYNYKVRKAHLFYLGISLEIIFSVYPVGHKFVLHNYDMQCRIIIVYI